MTYPHSQITWLAIGCPFRRRLSGPGLVTILGREVAETLKRTLRGMVRIQLCGQFAVVIDGRQIESRLPGRQGRLLVAYLATYRAQPVERTVLLEALWPDGGAVAAARSLPPGRTPGCSPAARPPATPADAASAAGPAMPATARTPAPSEAT